MWIEWAIDHISFQQHCVSSLSNTHKHLNSTEFCSLFRSCQLWWLLRTFHWPFASSSVIKDCYLVSLQNSRHITISKMHNIPLTTVIHINWWHLYDPLLCSGDQWSTNAAPESFIHYAPARFNDMAISQNWHGSEFPLEVYLQQS